MSKTIIFMIPQISLGFVFLLKFMIFHVFCLKFPPEVSLLFMLQSGVDSGRRWVVCYMKSPKKHRKGENPAATGDVPPEKGVTPAELSYGLLVNLWALRAWAPGAGPGCLPPRCVSEPALDRFRSIPAGVMLVLSLQVSIKLAWTQLLK